MIIDVGKFIDSGKPYWEELEKILDDLDRDAAATMTVEEIRRFHYLYDRVSSDLAKISTFASERETRQFLESLVARAYGEIHEIRNKPYRIRPLEWFFITFPRTFRRHLKAFHLAWAATLAGCLFGGLVLVFDPGSRDVVIPPAHHLIQSPEDRVAQEESATADRLKGVKTRGAAWYMTHNTGVAIRTLALGATWGIGTLVMLFATGVMVGAIAIDYILAGQTTFLVGWLLPHGSVEIPAILLAGQAGFVLAGALIGWGTRMPLRARLRAISKDLVTLIFGVAIMLVWAGIVEAFLSQYHEPTLPYSLKIGFGCIELILLILFLWRCGREKKAGKNDAASPAQVEPGKPL